jgi:K+-transporting ATPase ATPase B chain
MTRQTLKLFDPAAAPGPAGRAASSARVQWRNPVMFVVYVGSAFTTALAIAQPSLFTSAWRCGCGSPCCSPTSPKPWPRAAARPRRPAARPQAPDLGQALTHYQRGTPRQLQWHPLEADALRKGDMVLVEAGDVVPADGEVIDGVASVDESAITGESAR